MSGKPDKTHQSAGRKRRMATFITGHYCVDDGGGGAPNETDSACRRDDCTNQLLLQKNDNIFVWHTEMTRGSGSYNEDTYLARKAGLVTRIQGIMATTKTTILVAIDNNNNHNINND